MYSIERAVYTVYVDLVICFFSFGLRSNILDSQKNLSNFIWRPPSLSELTIIVFDMELTDLGSEASMTQTHKPKRCSHQNDSSFWWLHESAFF